MMLWHETHHTGRRDYDMMLWHETPHTGRRDYDVGKNALRIPRQGL